MRKAHRTRRRARPAAQRYRRFASLAIVLSSMRCSREGTHVERITGDERGALRGRQPSRWLRYCRRWPQDRDRTQTATPRHGRRVLLAGSDTTGPESRACWRGVARIWSRRGGPVSTSITSRSEICPGRALERAGNKDDPSTVSRVGKPRSVAGTLLRGGSVRALSRYLGSLGR